jgi:hypothetical protein
MPSPPRRPVNLRLLGSDVFRFPLSSPARQIGNDCSGLDSVSGGLDVHPVGRRSVNSETRRLTMIPRSPIRRSPLKK